MIYFDSAATTMQKPREVSRAVSEAIDHMASIGRGDSKASQSAADLLFNCRQAAADLFGVPSPEQVVFTFNATHGLNIAIKSLVKSGHSVLISGYEHNAVSRPLASIPGVQVRILNTPLFQPEVFLEQMRNELEQGVDVVICNHVSNVFGYILPVEEVASLCYDRGIPFLLDASQSAGTLPIHLERMHAAFVAMPGHKGLYGPQGTGLLLCGEVGEPLLYGGTGSLSFQRDMPDFLPDRLEAGTHNVAGIAGLLQGMAFVRKKGQANILRHEQSLKQMAAKGLRELPGVEVFSSPDPKVQSGVLSFRIRGHDCEEVGAYLSRHQVAIRSGFHCAPLAHQSAGTAETGTVRLSFSAFNTQQQVTRFLQILRGFYLS